MFGKIRNYLLNDIWCVRSVELGKAKALRLKIARVVLLAFKGFRDDKCAMRASALTFFSLLSIVPVVAMAFGVAKGFGFEMFLEKKLLEVFQGQEEVFQHVITFSRNMLDNTKGGLIAGIGVMFLFWTVIKVLGHIEHAFNDIWGVKYNRAFSRKFSDYLAIMLICPLLFILSSSVVVYISSVLQQAAASVQILGAIGPYVHLILKFSPIIIMWVLFSFLFIVMPNTNVRFVPGIISGGVTAVIYLVLQWGYISFQVGAAKYGAIYGSFAALPLFLIWLQLSWLVVLFGSEMGFALQYNDYFEFEPSCRNISLYLKKAVGLCIMREALFLLKHGGEPMSPERLAEKFALPLRMINAVLSDLEEIGFIYKVDSSKAAGNLYWSARDAHELRVFDLLLAIEKKAGADETVFVSTGEAKTAVSVMQRLYEECSTSEHNELVLSE